MTNKKVKVESSDREKEKEVAGTATGNGEMESNWHKAFSRGSRFIVVPPKWTDELDQRLLKERYGLSQDYRISASTELIYAYRDFNSALDQALMMLSGGLALISHCVGALSASEKIEWLTDYCINPDPRAELIELAAFCSWIHHERRRVLMRLRDPFIFAWAYPLIEVAHGLHLAAAALRDVRADTAREDRK
jgi:hypothetical protein